MKALYQVLALLTLTVGVCWKVMLYQWVVGTEICIGELGTMATATCRCLTAEEPAQTYLSLLSQWAQQCRTDVLGCTCPSLCCTPQSRRWLLPC